jgi:DNA-binding transcriptional ArsR family regulator
MSYQSALTALADPTRCRVFEELRRGPQSVGRIAAQMPVSRPAVSQHLGVLKRAGLVGDRAEGTWLACILFWLDRFWDDALLAFQTEIEKQESDR